MSSFSKNVLAPKLKLKLVLTKIAVKVHTHTHTQVNCVHVGVLFVIQESIFLMQIIFWEPDIFVKTSCAKRFC